MALSPTLPPMCDNTESSVIITGGTQGLGLAVARPDMGLVNVSRHGLRRVV